MATYQNDFKVKNSLVVRNTATISNLDNIQTVSASIVSSPTLNLSFNSPSIDPRISFTRASGATYVGADGFIKYAAPNVPRVEYSSTSTGTCLGLLIEEQRTNLFLASSTVGVLPNWNIRSGTVGTPNSGIAPDGTQTATLVSQSSGDGYVWQFYSSYTTSTTYTISVYASLVSGTPTIKFNIYTNPTVYQSSIFTLSSVLNRYTYTFTTGATVGSGDLGFYIVGGSALVWGAQFEQGGVSTSYIPTQSASVTRAVDLVTMNGQNFQSWYNQTAGTFYVENDSVGSTSTANYPRVLHISDGQAQVNTLQLIYNYTTSSSSISWADWQNGTFLNGINATPGGGPFITQGSFQKSAVTYSSSQITASIGGNSPTSASVSGLPLFLSKFGIGGYGFLNSTGQINGHVKRVAYWPSVLTNTQLQALTSATTFADVDFASKSTATSAIANTSNFIVKQGVVVGNNFEVPDVDKYYITNLTKPTQQSTLNLNFLRGVLDPRISFTRSSGATVVGSDSFIKYVGNNTPRIEYSSTSTGTCVGLLVEDQRTNLYTYSTNILNWAQVSVTTVLNSNISPDGFQNATYVSNTPNSGSYVRATGANTLNTSTTYTKSVYMKYISGSTTAAFECQVGSAFYNARFDISNQVFTAATTGTATVLKIGNGWARYSWTINTASTGPNNSDVIYIGAYGATATPTTFAIWGPQLEQGTFATSYIPTDSSQVTRAIDLATISGQNFQSWYRQDQGTLLVEADSIASTVDESLKFRWVVSLSQNQSNIQKMGFYKRPSNNDLLEKMIDNQNILKYESSLGQITTSTVFRAAISYRAGDQAGSLNGLTPTTGTVTTLPSILVDTLRIGNGDAPWCGHIRRVAFYPEKLSNTVTQSLTVI